MRIASELSHAIDETELAFGEYSKHLLERDTYLREHGDEFTAGTEERQRIEEMTEMARSCWRENRRYVDGMITALEALFADLRD